MPYSHFDADLAWRYLKEKRFELVEELIAGYKKELEAMEQKNEHLSGKADVLSIYGYYKCVHQGEKKAGIAFCERAVDRHPENPRHYLVLGMAWFYVGFPNKALEILEKGNRISPNYHPIMEAFSEVERRRFPVLSFLSRDNALNVAFGKLRHRWTGPKIKADKPIEDQIL